MKKVLTYLFRTLFETISFLDLDSIFKLKRYANITAMTNYKVSSITICILLIETSFWDKWHHEIVDFCVWENPLVFCYNAKPEHNMQIIFKLTHGLKWSKGFCFRLFQFIILVFFFSNDLHLSRSLHKN